MKYYLEHVVKIGGSDEPERRTEVITA